MCLINVEQEDGRTWVLRATDMPAGMCVGIMQVRRLNECFCIGVASGLGTVHNPKSGNDLLVYVKSIAGAVFPPAKDS